MTWQATGLRAWLWQRLSAVYMLVFVVGAALLLIVAPPLDYQRWQELVARPFPAIAIALFFLSLLAHSWVGMRDVILDYMHRPALRLLALSALGLGLLATAFWVAWILIEARP